MQSDCHRPAESIAAEIGLSASAVQRRLRRLRERGVIRAEVALLDAAGTGVAFVTKAGWPNGVVVHVSSMPVPFRIARSPLAAGILLLLLVGARVPLAT